MIRDLVGILLFIVGCEYVIIILHTTPKYKDKLHVFKYVIDRFKLLKYAS